MKEMFTNATEVHRQDDLVAAPDALQSPGILADSGISKLDISGSGLYG